MMSNVKTKPAKKLTRSTTDSLINYGIVIVLYIIMMIMQATGNLSSSMKGFLVPVCIYVIMAVSLNLVVGILGELSLGHAGFMCVGAYTSDLLKAYRIHHYSSSPEIYSCNSCRCIFCSCLRNTDRNPRSPS